MMQSNMMSRTITLMSFARKITFRSNSSLRSTMRSNLPFLFSENSSVKMGNIKSALMKHNSLFSTISIPDIDENELYAKNALQKADAVCFDVDSTVIQEEGIDVLAEFCGAGEQVAELTAKAMGGSMLFQDAIKARLNLIKPSRKAIADCLRQHPPPLSPGVKRFIQLLHDRGTDVYLVSGGFRLMIQPVADMVGVPHSRIYANTILFDENGFYKDFDVNEPTSRSGGKGKVMKLLQERKGYETVIMVGDGVTDMEARPPAAAFIGYGGVAEREAVVKGADWFVKDFEELINEIS